MADSPPTAGGVLIAFGAILGTVIGLLRGEPTLGFLAGLVLGAAIAGMIWWRQRNGQG